MEPAQTRGCPVTKTHITMHTPTAKLGVVSSGLRRTHVLLSIQQHERLVAQAHASARSVSQIVREAIEAHLGPGAAVRGPLQGIGAASGAARRFLAATPVDPKAG